MDAKDFVRSLWQKYYDKYEGPCKALRVEMCNLELSSQPFRKLLGYQALVEKSGGESFMQCALKYPEIDYHLRTKIARQAFDELRHHQLLADFLKELGEQIDDEVCNLYQSIRFDRNGTDRYYGIQTNRDFMSAMIGNVGEKNSDNFFQELYRRTTHPRLKEISHSINLDEKFHMALLDEKLQLFSKDPSSRIAAERLFKEAWEATLRNNIKLSEELGMVPEKILQSHGHADI